MEPVSGKTENRRISVILGPEAQKDLRRLRGQTRLTANSIFRQALAVYKIIVDANEEGEKVVILNPLDDRRQRVIELIRG